MSDAELKLLLDLVNSDNKQVSFKNSADQYFHEHPLVYAEESIPGWFIYYHYLKWCKKRELKPISYFKYMDYVRGSYFKYRSGGEVHFSVVADKYRINKFSKDYDSYLKARWNSKHTKGSNVWQKAQNVKKQGELYRKKRKEKKLLDLKLKKLKEKLLKKHMTKLKTLGSTQDGSQK